MYYIEILIAFTVNEIFRLHLKYNKILFFVFVLLRQSLLI